MATKLLSKEAGTCCLVSSQVLTNYRLTSGYLYSFKTTSSVSLSQGRAWLDITPTLMREYIALFLAII